MTHAKASAHASPTVGAWLCLGVVILFGLWLRAPQLDAAMPYFYMEDEGHHFNRLVEMVQDGRFNPNYFNKPSLHFYLRMPAVAGGFLWAARANQIESIQDIVTRDDAGLGGRAWSASHPTVLKWTRSVSTLLSLLTILLTYLLAVRLVESPWMALTAALLVACSPPLVADSAKVGVDTLMTAMCVATIYLATRVMAEPSIGRIVATGLVAGLAVSSKYNAAPIAAVPLVACVLAGRSTAVGLGAALVTPAVGFLVGTPYALIELPRFLDGMAFEVRHYGVMGHGIATIEPGWPHARAFIGWMLRVAVGVVPTVLGLVGAGLLVWRRPRIGSLILMFPVCFILLMVSQRVLFFRNLLVMIPFFCVMVAWAAEGMVPWVRARPWLPARAAAVWPAILVILITTQPVAQAVRSRQALVTTPPDSRVRASQWLAETSPAYSDVAIAAELQFVQADYAARGVARVATDDIEPVSLFLGGFDRVVAGSRFDPGDRRDLLPVERVFPGRRDSFRIRRNPEIAVYGLPASLGQHAGVRRAVESDPRYWVTPPTYLGESSIPRFGQDWRCDAKVPGDGPDQVHCLVRSRVARIVLDPDAVGAVVAVGNDVDVALELRTPWPSQSCTLELPGWTSSDLCVGLELRKWERRTTAVPAWALAGRDAFVMVLTQVHAPHAYGLSNDRRRIGVWVRAVALSPRPAGASLQDTNAEVWGRRGATSSSPAARAPGG